MSRCTRCGAQVPSDRLEACPRCLFEGTGEKVVLDDTLELGEEIGRGGMGAVYKARHLRMDRPVAVKFLPEELAAQPEFKARFEREGRALAMLNHPNIVTIHDLGEGYIVMEHVEGGSLSGRMPLAPDRALEAAVQICEALVYAHGQGIVHRDIKPANILFDASGRVKITDFGISRLVGGEKGWTITEPGAAAGTPHYISPEAMSGAEPDPRMDLYSLGVVLYQMVTGRLPLGDFEPAPMGFDRVIRRALAPDPDKRYTGAKEMLRDLSAIDLGRVEELEPHEELWIKGVATLQSISTAVALWTVVLSISPKIIPAGDVMPIVMIGVQDLGDGTVMTRARFETWWTIATLATFALAITAYAFLRLHWRRSGLEKPMPDRPVPDTKWVVVWGLVALAVYGIRVLTDWGGEKFVYWPLLSGAMEVVVLFFFWVSVLKAWRVSRPLRREPWLWAGLALAFIPLVIELYRFIDAV
jgi:serine/threonine-protein kinase